MSSGSGNYDDASDNSKDSFVEKLRLLANEREIKRKIEEDLIRQQLEKAMKAKTADEVSNLV